MPKYFARNWFVLFNLNCLCCLNLILTWFFITAIFFALVFYFQRVLRCFALKRKARMLYEIHHYLFGSEFVSLSFGPPWMSGTRDARPSDIKRTFITCHLLKCECLVIINSGRFAQEAISFLSFLRHRNFSSALCCCPQVASRLHGWQSVDHSARAPERQNHASPAVLRPLGRGCQRTATECPRHISSSNVLFLSLGW